MINKKYYILSIFWVIWAYKIDFSLYNIEKNPKNLIFIVFKIIFLDFQSFNNNYKFTILDFISNFNLNYIF